MSAWKAKVNSDGTLVSAGSSQAGTPTRVSTGVYTVPFNVRAASVDPFGASVDHAAPALNSNYSLALDGSNLIVATVRTFGTVAGVLNQPIDAAFVITLEMN